MSGIEVISEQIREHERRISGVEDMAHETAEGARDLLVVTERHAVQLDMLMKVTYGSLGLAITSVIGMMVRRG